MTEDVWFAESEGIFATATLLASVPLLALGLTDTRLFVTGITHDNGEIDGPPTPGIR